MWQFLQNYLRFSYLRSATVRIIFGGQRSKLAEAFTAGDCGNVRFNIRGKRLRNLLYCCLSSRLLRLPLLNPRNILRAAVLG
jgi:hypothetical protein